MAVESQSSWVVSLVGVTDLISQYALQERSKIVFLKDKQKLSYLEREPSKLHTAGVVLLTKFGGDNLHVLIIREQQSDPRYLKVCAPTPTSPPGCPAMTCRYSEANPSCPDTGLQWVTGTGCSGDNCVGCTYIGGCSTTSCISPGATPTPGEEPLTPSPRLPPPIALILLIPLTLLSRLF